MVYCAALSLAMRMNVFPLSISFFLLLKNHACKDHNVKRKQFENLDLSALETCKKKIALEQIGLKAMVLSVKNLGRC